MKKDIYIGVDGGGTKTKVIIEDSVGHKIGEGVGGASNIRLSVTQAWDSINTAISQALKGTSLTLDNWDYRFNIGLGLAGVSIVEAKKDFLNTEHNFSNIILESDAYIACLGAHDGKDGSIVSVGTGVIGYSISLGKVNRVSGWGFPHADTGGGSWLGMEAVRITFRSIDGCIEPSELTESVFSHFNKNLAKFVAWANSANSTQFAELAPYVVKAAKKNDNNAISLLKKAAEETEMLAEALRKKSEDAQDLTCYLLGGLSPFIMPHINNKKKISLCPEGKSAAKGAIYLIRSYC